MFCYVYLDGIDCMVYKLIPVIRVYLKCLPTDAVKKLEESKDSLLSGIINELAKL